MRERLTPDGTATLVILAACLVAVALIGHARPSAEPQPVSGVPSSDGSSLAVVFYSGRDGNFEVYQVDADGRNPVRLTNDPAWDGWASYVRLSKGRS